MRKLHFLFTMVVLCLALSGCSNTRHEVEETNPGIILFHRQEYSFEELIEHSDVALVGEYVEMIEQENFYEYKFIVKELLYGEVSELEIYIFENKGGEYTPETGSSRVLGVNEYILGKEYILIMEKYESILYDHDRYMIAGELYLCEEEQEYRLFSESISIPEGKTIREYILALADPAKTQPLNQNIVYADLTERMVNEAQYIGTIKIVGLEMEGKVHNGNTYRCIAESMLKGNNINTYEDGTFLLTLLKDTVEVGKSYLIGFTPASGSTSLIYVQATVDSVMEASAENVNSISERVK